MFTLELFENGRDGIQKAFDGKLIGAHYHPRTDQKYNKVWFYTENIGKAIAKVWDIKTEIGNITKNYNYMITTVECTPAPEIPNLTK